MYNNYVEFHICLQKKEFYYTGSMLIIRIVGVNINIGYDIVEEYINYPDYCFFPLCVWKLWVVLMFIS